ncbi:hypothetical protein QJS10_CPB14g01459 [Acorus calamus]|uniref:RNase H type-1 domain-containing protein n=1 Tax=Acorus calamus TaxID=4465 RepID=A0AAV9DCV6_ACOCL|nr:hypothetical protein QJS10_CPB14g01459 [Acorus calamus]
MGNSKSSSSGKDDPSYRAPNEFFSSALKVGRAIPNHDEYKTDHKNKTVVMLGGEDLYQAPREVTWRPLNPGWCKVNSDASRSWKPGRAGLGFIIRDEDLNFVAGAAFRVKLDDISILELMAAAKGLKRAIELGFRRVWLESDCQTVVAWIQGKGKPSLTATLILIRIDVYVSKLKDFSISHIHREGNKPADFLASLNQKMGVKKINLHNMPPKLQEEIESDKRRYCAQLRRR